MLPLFHRAILRRKIVTFLSPFFVLYPPHRVSIFVLTVIKRLLFRLQRNLHKKGRN